MASSVTVQMSNDSGPGVLLTGWHLNHKQILCLIPPHPTKQMLAMSFQQGPCPHHFLAENNWRSACKCSAETRILPPGPDPGFERWWRGEGRRGFSLVGGPGGKLCSAHTRTNRCHTRRTQSNKSQLNQAHLREVFNLWLYIQLHFVFSLQNWQ